MTKYLLISIAIALAYFLTGYIGLQMPAVGTSITLIWLPTGIAVASLFRFGYRFWPAISVASVCVNLATGDAWLTCIGIAIGNTLAPLLTVSLLYRLKFNRRFERQYDIALLACAAHLCMLISASIGVAVLSISASLTNDFLKAWLCWWAGDSMGVIAAAPLFLVASRAEFKAIQKRSLEFASWLILTILVTGCVFVLNENIDEPAWALAFLPLPLIAWATLRFGATGTSLAIIVISSGAAFGTSIQTGPFYRVEATQQVLLLWMYMVTIATLGWLITALQFNQLKAVNIQKILEAGLRDASLGVLLTDSKRLITYVNEGFTRITGYGPKDLLGRNCNVLQGEKSDPKSVNEMRANLNAGRHFDGEIINYRKDGSTFWNRLLISPIFDDAGEMVGFFGFQRDITTTKEIEFALQRSETRLRTILKLEPECVTIISTEGLILEMNQAGLNMIQADSVAQAIGIVWESIIDDRFREEFRRVHSQILAGGSGLCVFPIVGFKGAERWVESHAVPYLDTDEKIIGQLAVTRDITERKQAEDELRASELRYRQLFKNNPHPMWVYDLESLKFLAVNDAAIEHYGYSHDEFLSMTIIDIRPPEDVPALIENLAKANSGFDKAGVWRHRTKAGNFIKVDITSHVTEFNGRRGELVLANDVTERTRLEEQVHATQLRLETLVSNLPGMAYRCQNDFNWTMSYVSSGCEAVTGYHRDELENNKSVTYADLVHPEDREWLWSKCQAAQDAHTPCSNIYRIIDKTGQIRWVIERASGVYAEDGIVQCIDGFIQDITEARRIEEQVRASLREKEAMLKEIHHRVKNNLQIVTSLLNLQVGSVQDPSVLNALKESQNRIRSMALVHETLYQSSNLGTIDLSQYVDALCGNLFRSYGTDVAKVRLLLNVAKTTLDLERAIPFGLIINELVSNALKYAFPGGRAGKVEVTFNTESTGHFTLRVEDDGIGLPTSLDLTQLKSLGLQLVQDLIQQLSGTLTIDRTHGTEFCINFPIRSHQEC